MPWLILLISAVFEAVWATSLGNSDGLSRPVPTGVFAVTLTISMLGLGWAAKSIPIGTAYSVWVGVGAALTVSWAIGTGAEEFSAWKVLFISGIILAVVGLRLVPTEPRLVPTEPPPAAEEPGHRRLRRVRPGAPNNEEHR